MVVALEDIIKTGKHEGEFGLTKPREDGVIKFHRISKAVKLGNESYKTSVLISEDKNGKRFYNLNDNAEGYSKDKAPKGTSPVSVKPVGANDRNDIVSTHNIVPSAEEINIFLEAL